MADEHQRTPCTESACGHPLGSHKDYRSGDGRDTGCLLCTCQAFESIAAQRLPGREGLAAMMVQLEFKVAVYETRNETQVRTIETLKTELNQKDGEINGLALANAAAESAITELKQELGATRFMLGLLADAGHLPENFVKSFMPGMPKVGMDDEAGYFDGESGDMVVDVRIVEEDGDWRV